VVGCEQGVGDDLRQRARGLLALGDVGRWNLLDVEVPCVEDGIEGVDGLFLVPGPLVGIEGGQDDQVGQADGSADLGPDRQRLAADPFLLLGVDDEPQLPQQVPVQVLVPSELGGESLVRGVARMLLKEGRGEARQTLGRGVLVRLGFDSPRARSCSQSLIRD
jgi:hypothetical protein